MCTWLIIGASHGVGPDFAQQPPAAGNAVGWLLEGGWPERLPSDWLLLRSRSNRDKLLEPRSCPDRQERD